MQMIYLAQASQQEWLRYHSFQRDLKRSGYSYSLIVAKGTVFVKHFLLLLDTVVLLYRDQFHLLYTQSSYTKVLQCNPGVAA